MMYPSRDSRTGKTKEQLIGMFMKGTLYDFLLKKRILKEGEGGSYAKILDLSDDDLRSFFDIKGYPGLRESPPWEEWGYAWTFEEGYYRILFIERGLPTTRLYTASKEEFEAWWKKHTLEIYSAKLHNR